MVYLKYSKKHRDKIQKLLEKFRKMSIYGNQLYFFASKTSKAQNYINLTFIISPLHELHREKVSKRKCTSSILKLNYS